MLCLKWEDFQGNIGTSFKKLRETNDICDVTLVSKDGHNMKAHKVVLAASSPVFLDMLQENPHPHPLIYMRGIKTEDLVAILNFMYNGETNVYHENLQSFLKFADELNLKGLPFSGQSLLTNSLADHQPDNTLENPKQSIDIAKCEVKSSVQTATDNIPMGYALPLITKERELKPYGENGQQQLEDSIVDRQLESSLEHVSKSKEIIKSATRSTTLSTENKSLLIAPILFSGYIQDLNEKVNSMMILGQFPTLDGKQKATVCQVCGLEGYKIQIRNHIEAKHVEIISVTCNICEKVYRTRNTLKGHKYNTH